MLTELPDDVLRVVIEFVGALQPFLRLRRLSPSDNLHSILLNLTVISTRCLLEVLSTLTGGGDVTIISASSQRTGPQCDFGASPSRAHLPSLTFVPSLPPPPPPAAPPAPIIAYDRELHAADAVALVHHYHSTNPFLNMGQSRQTLLWRLEKEIASLSPRLSAPLGEAVAEIKDWKRDYLAFKRLRIMGSAPRVCPNSPPAPPQPTLVHRDLVPSSSESRNTIRLFPFSCNECRISVYSQSVTSLFYADVCGGGASEPPEESASSFSPSSPSSPPPPPSTSLPPFLAYQSLLADLSDSFLPCTRGVSHYDGEYAYPRTLAPAKRRGDRHLKEALGDPPPSSSASAASGGFLISESGSDSAATATILPDTAFSSRLALRSFPGPSCSFQPNAEELRSFFLSPQPRLAGFAFPGGGVTGNPSSLHFLIRRMKSNCSFPIPTAQKVYDYHLYLQTPKGCTTLVASAHGPITSSGATGSSPLEARKAVQISCPADVCPSPSSPAKYAGAETPANVIVASLVSNYLGTEFVLIDEVRKRELATMSYIVNLFGNQPREMSAVIPCVDDVDQPMVWNDGDENFVGRVVEGDDDDDTNQDDESAASAFALSELNTSDEAVEDRRSSWRSYIGRTFCNLLRWLGLKRRDFTYSATADTPGQQRPRSSMRDAWRTGSKQNLFQLSNVPPWYNEQLHAFVLNFHGRVTIASVKNFQLVRSSITGAAPPGTTPADIILQFGKVGEEDFHFDLRWPMSPLQGFAICLSSLASKKVV